MFRNLPRTETEPELYVQLQERFIHPYLPKLTVPTLLIWGAEDATVPIERGLLLLRILSQGDLHVFGRAAHMVMLDRADDFARLLASWAAPA